MLHLFNINFQIIPSINKGLITHVLAILVKILLLIQFLIQFLVPRTTSHLLLPRHLILFLLKKILLVQSSKTLLSISIFHQSKRLAILGTHNSSDLCLPDSSLILHIRQLNQILIVCAIRTF